MRTDDWVSIFHARDLLDRAECPQRGAASFVGGLACRDIALDQSLEVRAQFLVHLSFVPFPAEQPGEADKHGTKCFHVRCFRPSSHSARSAIIGSTFVARRAGSQQATSAIVPSRSVTTVNAIGSKAPPSPNSTRRSR